MSRVASVTALIDWIEGALAMASRVPARAPPRSRAGARAILARAIGCLSRGRIRIGVGDQVGHRVAVPVAVLAQARHHPGAIGGPAVLADLPLALEASHRDLDAHDGPELALDEVGRRVGHLPGHRAR